MNVRIGLLSDTHGFLDPSLLAHFKDCDEIWHAGDVGEFAVLDQLYSTRKVIRAVYGNIDSTPVRAELQRDESFETGGAKVLMTHIAGYPGRYNKRIVAMIHARHPDIVVAGHSHILKIMYDRDLAHLHINPGAAGRHGFHKMRTAVRFTIADGVCSEMQVIELGLRGALTEQ